MSKIWLLGVVGFVAALVVAGLIVALVARDDSLLSADSPEGTVQRYLLALEDTDYREAYGYLDAGTQSACDFSEFLKYASYREVRDVRVTLEDTQQIDDTAIVRAEVTVFDIDTPFEPYEYSYTETFNLQLEAGQWRLVSPDYWCPAVS